LFLSVVGAALFPQAEKRKAAEKARMNWIFFIGFKLRWIDLM
jgi:hypothetical protein